MGGSKIKNLTIILAIAALLIFGFGCANLSNILTRAVHTDTRY